MSEDSRCRVSQRRQFRIRFAVLLLAIGIAASATWIAVEWRQVARRKNTCNWIVAQGGSVVSAEAMFKTSDEAKQANRLGRVRTLLNDVEIAYVILPRSASADDLARIRAVLPELSDGIGVFWTPVLVNPHFEVAAN